MTKGRIAKEDLKKKSRSSEAFLMKRRKNLQIMRKHCKGYKKKSHRFETTKSDPGTGLQQQFEFTGRDVEPFEARTTHLQEVFSVETK